MRAVTAQKMRQIDKTAIEQYGIRGIVLMENAGKAVSEVIMAVSENIPGTIAIFCGRGNNGGDGFVTARHLLNKGKKVDIYLLGEVDRVKEDAKINLNILLKMRQPIHRIADIKSFKKLRRKFNASIIVDAIYGTGFTGHSPEIASHLMNFLNSLKIPIISVDVPSGLDATTGKSGGPCLKAATTVTFGIAKTGFLKNDGPLFAGKIVVADIGLPGRLLK